MQFANVLDLPASGIAEGWRFRIDFQPRRTGETEGQFFSRPFFSVMTEDGFS